MRATVAVLSSPLLLMLALFSCSSPSEPITYERIVIETFSPDGSATADTFIDLFDASGDPDADDPWTGDDTADAIAYDDNGNPIPSAAYSRIDYTGGLTSGTYYIRVRGVTDLIDDPYAIRALSLGIGDSIPASPALLVAAFPDSQEPDDSPQSGGVPTDPVALGMGNANALSRSIGAGDIDWFVLVLP